MNLSRYVVKKPVAAIQAESQQSELKRSLSALNLTSLGIGCIIGAGIFVLTGQAAATHAGPAIMLSFILAGLACTFAALCYAELASVLPVSGSAYTYAYATLGEVFAWAMGWLLILEYGLASATVAVGWSGYLNSILLNFNMLIPPELVNPVGAKIIINSAFQGLYEAHGYLVSAEGLLTRADGSLVLGIFNLPAFLGIMAVTALLVAGVSESASVNNVIVVVKLAVVVTFIVVGLTYIDSANWSPFIPPAITEIVNGKEVSHFGWPGVLTGAGAIFFAYIGFESVSTAAQEAKNPQRDMPIGILASLFICTVLYMLVAAVLTGVVHYSKLGVPDPIAVAVDTMGLTWLSYVIKLGAIMGLSSVMLVLVYGQTRIFYMMSKDGLIPAFFSTLHGKYKTPYINTIVVGVIVAVAAALTPIRVLGDLVSMGTLAAFVIVCFSVIYLRYKEPGLVRPFKVPFFPVVPVLGMLFCGYLMYGLGTNIFLALKVWFIFGVLIYLAYGQFGSKLASGLTKGKKLSELTVEEFDARVVSLLLGVTAAIAIVCYAVYKLAMYLEGTVAGA